MADLAGITTTAKTHTQEVQSLLLPSAKPKSKGMCKENKNNKNKGIKQISAKITPPTKTKEK